MFVVVIVAIVTVAVPVSIVVILPTGITARSLPREVVVPEALDGVFDGPLGPAVDREVHLVELFARSFPEVDTDERVSARVDDCLWRRTTTTAVVAVVFVDVDGIGVDIVDRIRRRSTEVLGHVGIEAPLAEARHTDFHRICSSYVAAKNASSGFVVRARLSRERTQPDMPATPTGGMRLTAEPIDIGTRTPTVLLNSVDASEIGVHPLDRVRIQFDGGTTTGIVEVTDELVARGTLGVTRPLGHVTGHVEVVVAEKPESVVHLREKLVDEELEVEELRTIIEDIERDRLNDVELSAFVSGVFANGLSREEMQGLTSCMVDVGETLEWEQAPIGDKHSIGGVAGNRVTPIVVAIVAAAEVPIPKTSSRAVTSAAGTADTLEVFCDVEFTLEEIREIVERTNGCMVWGGSVDLSPVDDKIIRAETPISIDPKGQIVASVLSKKKSAGSTHVVIDIPYGEGAKVETLSEAREMARDFNRVGQGLGMEIDCAITRGEQPVGRGVGPVLEARDVLAVLEGDGPDDLRIKSERLAQVLLDATGVEASAGEILADGRAIEKFREIVDAQRGDPDVSVDDLVPGQHVAAYTADRDGVVTHVDNRRVNELARRAGAPKDIRAGVCLDCRVGERIQQGAELLAIHAQKESKLEQARSFADANTPVRVLPEDEALVEQL